MTRIRGLLAYDGTGYGGFQVQQNAPSIQAELEGVLRRLTGTEVRVLAAGRTDAGVHATGQVIAFDLPERWHQPLPVLQRAMNALLPAQIAVLCLDEAPAGFHPRYAARRRGYAYWVYHAPVRHPFVERWSWHVPAPLDEAAMQAATQALIGRHDFSAFGSPPQGDNPVREVFRAGWRSEAPWLVFEIEADAFLYRMVRMLVGTLVRVGMGRLSPEDVAAILRQKARHLAGPAAPAHGLVLTSVAYDDGWPGELQINHEALKFVLRGSVTR